MSNTSVKINDSILRRLRKYLAKKHEGEMYGKITEAVNEAVNEYLNKHEIEFNVHNTQLCETYQNLKSRNENDIKT